MLHSNDPVDLRDFARPGVLDTPANRARRAAFFHSLPGRLMVELEEMPADVDQAIDEETLDQPASPLARFAAIAAIILFGLALLAQVRS